MLSAIVFALTSVVVGWAGYSSVHAAIGFWTVDPRISCCFIAMAASFAAMTMFSIWFAVSRLARAISDE